MRGQERTGSYAKLAQDAIFSCDDTPRHFLARVCLDLRDESVVPQQSNSLLIPITHMMTWDPGRFSAIEHAEGTGFVPSIMICLRRQWCGHEEVAWVNDAVSLAISSL